MFTIEQVNMPATPTCWLMRAIHSTHETRSAER